MADDPPNDPPPDRRIFIVDQGVRDFMRSAGLRVGSREDEEKLARVIEWVVERRETVIKRTANRRAVWIWVIAAVGTVVIGQIAPGVGQWVRSFL